jgi:hypothetical protein
MNILSLTANWPKALFVPTAGLPNTKHNIFHAKAMKPVFHSSLDVGRSMSSPLWFRPPALGMGTAPQGLDDVSPAYE